MGIHGRHVLETQSPERVEEQGIVGAHDLAVAREAIERGKIEVVRMTVRKDHHIDRSEAVEIDHALRSGDHHPILEGILQNRVHQDSHRTRLDQNRGMSEKRDLHSRSAHGKHSLRHSDRAAPVVGAARPLRQLRGSRFNR